jgi:hypothetical protein
MCLMTQEGQSNGYEALKRFFIGQNHVWELSGLLQKGIANNRNDFQCDFVTFYVLWLIEWKGSAHICLL